jgi:hypothetical protein
MHVRHLAHVIEIDRLVLDAAIDRPALRLRSLIEAEIVRALSGARLPVDAGSGDLRARIAGEVARSVVGAVRGSER